MMKDGEKACPQCGNVPLAEEWTLHSIPCMHCTRGHEDWCIHCCSSAVSTGGEFCQWIAEWAEEERSHAQVVAEDEALEELDRYL